MSNVPATWRAKRVAGSALAAIVGTAALCGSVLVASTSAYAESAVGLGTAESFAVLAGSGITNTGATTITGDVGSFPTTTQTGFGSVTLHGTNHFGDAVTQAAKNDLVTAYDEAAGRTSTPLDVELGGKTLFSGVYDSPTFGLTGTLTLDAQGDPNAEFIFQAGSTLITATDSRVRLINGADPCRVVWQVGSSATFGTRTAFVGDVLALTSITANTAATFEGRLLARNGAVTMDNNTITNASCFTSSGTTSTTAASTTTSSTVATTSTTALPTTPTTTATTLPTATTLVPVASGPASPSGATGTPISPEVAPASGALGSTPGGVAGAVPSSGTPAEGGSTPALATTGAPLAALAMLGLGLLSLGSIVVRAARRRRPDLRF